MTEQQPQNQPSPQNPPEQPQQEERLNPLAEASRPLSDAPALFRALWKREQKK